MLLTNGDKLKNYLEHIIQKDVFTTAELLVIIDSFSSKVPNGAAIYFQQDEKKDITCTSIDYNPMGAEWIQETVETEYGKFPKLLCSSCRNPRAQIPMNYCGNCGEKMKNPDATIKGETTYEK